jgi:hypothetical protein
MAANVFKTITSAVATRFATIATSATYTPPGGSPQNYKTDAGTNVSTWRDLERVPYTHDSDFPAINVMDQGSELDGGTTGVALHHHRQGFEISIAAGSIDTLRDLAGDIYGAVYDDETWSGTAYRTDWEGYNLGMVHAENKIFGGIVRFAILIKTGRGNPEGA